MSNRIFYSEYFYQKVSKDTSVLERNANEYPYSSLASFLLLYHYKKTSNPAFEKFAKKTALLFNNPHWLQFQLFDKSAPISEQEIFSGENFQDENEEIPLEASSTENAMEEPASKPEQENSSDENILQENEIVTIDNNEIPLEAFSTENAMEEPASKPEKENSSDENILQENEIVTIDNNEIPLETSSMENVMEESTSKPEHENNSDENIQDENEIVTINNNEISLQHSPIENVMEERDVAREESTLKETGVEEIQEINAETAVNSLDEEVLQHETENLENSERPESGTSLQSKEIMANENTLTETQITIDAAIENAAAEKAETENENAANENEPIAFEPLHTVDYFASQGIKITEELLTKDKLGSQMKSFTAWLKSMKKLHPGKLEEQSLATEKLIQASANESNFNTEILTEAMAEVLIKQDKKEKAIEMFTKLSLINPSKSAYFAARIESIKSN